jgi:hypothetical protein
MRGFLTRRMSRGRMDSHRQGWSVRRGIARSRMNGAWDMRRGPRPVTIERDRWTGAFLRRCYAMSARLL